MPYEKRVGERIEVGDLRVRWRHVHGPRKRHKRAKRGRKHDLEHGDAYMRNVSASGAGISAPPDDSTAPGTVVEVQIGPENSFVGRVTRIVPTFDVGWWYYGVEIADESQGFRDWLHGLLDIRRNNVITESHWRSSF